MRDGLWTCVRCGALVRDTMPARGLAHRFDPRPYCAFCLRLGILAPTPTQPVVPFPTGSPLQRSG